MQQHSCNSFILSFKVVNSTGVSSTYEPCWFIWKNSLSFLFFRKKTSITWFDPKDAQLGEYFLKSASFPEQHYSSWGQLPLSWDMLFQLRRKYGERQTNSKSWIGMQWDLIGIWTRPNWLDWQCSVLVVSSSSSPSWHPLSLLHTGRRILYRKDFGCQSICHQSPKMSPAVLSQQRKRSKGFSQFGLGVNRNGMGGYLTWKVLYVYTNPHLLGFNFIFILHLHICFTYIIYTASEGSSEVRLGSASNGR